MARGESIGGIPLAKIIWADGMWGDELEAEA